MSKRTKKPSQNEQSKHFIEMARELGVPEGKAAEDRVFGKIGLKKPPAKPKKLPS